MSLFDLNNNYYFFMMNYVIGPLPHFTNARIHVSKQGIVLNVPNILLCCKDCETTKNLFAFKVSSEVFMLHIKYPLHLSTRLLNSRSISFIYLPSPSWTPRTKAVLCLFRKTCVGCQISEKEHGIKRPLTGIVGIL